MSGKLRIRFGGDMPVATVEVIAPNLDIVDRLMLSAGRSKVVEVPSEASFLRVYLPSGQVTTLADPGNLDREVTLRDIMSRGRQDDPRSLFAGAYGPSLQDISAEEAEPDDVTTLAHLRRYHKIRAAVELAPGLQQTDIPLGSHAVARLMRADGSSATGSVGGRGREARWDVAGPPQEPPLTLTIEQSFGERLELRLPGDVRRVWARADLVREREATSYSVRLSTNEPTADAIVGFLHRGDLDSAEVMAEWTDEARIMLREKMEDPYAACVGAYLLLRLRRFQEMKDWARNLADRFPLIPDGCVIWAAQLQYNSPTNVDEIRNYLLQAAQRGLPVYSVGLRLLSDGLRLLGNEDAEAREKFLARAGAVLWSSPVTASIHTSGTYSRETPHLVAYDVALAAKA
jgi:hypothetical protein